MRVTEAKSTVAVLDYGMGNLHSVANALRTVAPNAEVLVGANPEEIIAADRVVFPGVGAIRDCMAEIRRLGFDELVVELSKTKPLLAVCVGLQALMTRSEENDGVDCINFFSGDVRLFADRKDADGNRLKVPHMGWNCVDQRTPHSLWESIPTGSRFYFVHSYFIAPEDESIITGTTDYGTNFAAALARDNVFATQFHPEKSHTLGLQLLANFMRWDGAS
ncbi:MAG: imidazole glycerol phosphate synthase subunit HisH [Pseudomonadales bacterium]